MDSRGCTLSNGRGIIEFKEHFFSYISRQRRRGYVPWTSVSACTTGNITLVEGCDIEIVCLPQNFSLNIAQEKLKFAKRTALGILFLLIVELVIFMNILLHTFQGIGDGVMYSRAL